MRNRGGVFEDVTLAAGLGEPIASQAAGWADYDNDGHVDLYVAGEFDVQHPEHRNRGRLYHNRGDGTFEDVAAAAGVTNDRFGKGVAWGDYDDDGLARPLRLQPGPGQPALSQSGRRHVRRRRRPCCSVTEPIDGFACWFWDYDNDGRLDLWVNPNHATLSEVIARPARPADDRRAAASVSQRRPGRTVPRRDGRARAGPGRPADGLELRRPGQ